VRLAPTSSPLQFATLPTPGSPPVAATASNVAGDLDRLTDDDWALVHAIAGIHGGGTDAVSDSLFHPAAHPAGAVALAIATARDPERRGARDALRDGRPVHADWLQRTIASVTNEAAPDSRAVARGFEHIARRDRERANAAPIGQGRLIDALL
jgi:hypothetical protein